MKHPVYPLNKRAWLTFLAVLIAPFPVHELFHLLDYFVWGLKTEPSLALKLLLPFFDETPLGLAVHTGTFLAAMSLFAILFIREWRRDE